MRKKTHYCYAEDNNHRRIVVSGWNLAGDDPKVGIFRKVCLKCFQASCHDIVRYAIPLFSHSLWKCFR